MQEELCSFVKQFTWEGTEEEIRGRAKRTFADAVSAMLAGSRAEQVFMTARALGVDLIQESRGEAPFLVGFGCRKANLLDAVLLNAVSAHSCEYNDLFYGLPGHPSAVLVPVVLGLGEKLHKGGKEVLEAYLCGLEVLGRVNEALMPEHHIRGFHSTSTVGIIGAAMAAGKLLELNCDQLMYACSIAETFACGLRGNFGYHTVSLHAGNAAANGLRAALLAQAGIRARQDLMELPDGYMAAFSGDRKRMERNLKRLGSESVLECPGILLKKFPVCYSAFQAIEASLAIRAAGGISAEDVERVVCLTSPNHAMSLPMEWPDSIYAQRFCIPFCVCWCLNGGNPGVRELSQFHGDDAGLLLLKEKLRYGVDPQQKGDTGFGNTWLQVIWKDGTERSVRAYPDERDRAEHWSESALKEKFRQSAEGLLKESDIDGIWQELGRLEQISDIAGWLRNRWRKE